MRPEDMEGNLDSNDTERSSATQQGQQALTRSHERHCFVVMPYGRTETEVKWFRGWYKAVIEPAVGDAGYEPILSADEEFPEAINDEVRRHLAYDPMVVVDLGGMSADSEPNPNVMYELGIRHALNLPLVMMAWRDQRLPFDISNQRVIMEGRDMIDIGVNKDKLASFIKAASRGQFYRPMEAVGRAATLEVASASLDRDSVLRALVQEVRDLRESLHDPYIPRGPKWSSAHALPQLGLTVKTLLGSKPSRKPLHKAFLEAGGTVHDWGVLLDSVPSRELVEIAGSWTQGQWEKFIRAQARQFREERERQGNLGFQESNELTVAHNTGAQPDEYRAPRDPSG